MCFLYAIWLPHKARKIFQQQKNLQLVYETEIGPETFSSKSENGSANLAWKDFHKYKIGKDLILVYPSDLMFHIFPKRWFTEEQFAELQRILHANLGPAKW